MPGLGHRLQPWGEWSPWNILNQVLGGGGSRLCFRLKGERLQSAESSNSHSPAEGGEFSPSSKAERKPRGLWEMGLFPISCLLSSVTSGGWCSSRFTPMKSPGITLEQQAGFERLLSSVRPTPGPGWRARSSVGGPLSLFSRWFCFIGPLSETDLW